MGLNLHWDIQWDLADKPLKGLINPCNDPEPTEIDVSENEVCRIPPKKRKFEKEHCGFKPSRF